LTFDENRIYSTFAIRKWSTVVTRITKVFLLLVLVAACDSSQPPVSEIADTVYIGGRIYTVNDDQPWAQAIAIKDGRFISVDSDQEMQQYIGETTEVVDLGGTFVMPGLQDAHIHTQMIAEFNHNLSIDPEGSWNEISAAIKKYALDHPDRQWILGGNLPWLTNVIGDNALIRAHRSVLDELAPDHAVALWDVGGHALLVNSKGLALAGIDDDTADPIGGTIERDADGVATGVVRELATSLVLENATAMTVDEYATGLKAAMSQLSSLGITSINEVWTFPTTLKALKQLDEANELQMRVVASIAHPVEFVTEPAKQAANELIENREEFTTDRLKPRYVKFVLDGSAGGQTLALIDPYEGTDFRGDLRNPEDVVKSEVSRLHGEGIGSVLHAVGDRAVEIALDAVEAAIAKHGQNGTRHTIAHSVFVNPKDLNRFAELGVIAEFSPYFWWPGEGQEILRDELGEERLTWGFPIKAIQESGAHLAAGSDWPVVFDPNPFPALEAMVTREHPGGSEDNFGKEHAISVSEALKIFTMGSAYALHQEETTGSIEVGKFADFIVLDNNLLEIPVREIHGTRVDTTVLEGEVIYKRNVT
jgi:predicted amidohydrolase YtcJ